MRILRTIFIAILIFMGAAGYSQGWYARYSAGVKWDFARNWQMELKPEIHLRSMQEPAEWLLDYSLEYDVWKFLELGANFRLNSDITKEPDRYTLRYSADITFKQDIKRFDVQLRSRYSNYTEYEEIPDYRRALRLKGKISYNIRNWKADPELFLECYFAAPEFSVSKVKYGGAIDWNLPSGNSVFFGYFYQDYPQKEKYIHVFEAGWELRIK